MNKLAFVIWVMGWPLAAELCNYVAALKYKLRGHEQPSREDEIRGWTMVLAVWVIVAVLVWRAS